jgi:hypothetical protein
MFRYEKDMIPVLKDNLSMIYNTEHFVEEFDSGIGIADLVFTTKSMTNRETLEDFEAVYYLTNYFNIRHKKIFLKEVQSKFNLKKNKMGVSLDFLKTYGQVEEGENREYVIVKKMVEPVVQNLFSIEAKLSDWKSGLFQALRYKNYSQKTFLAMSENYIHRVDQSLLKANNVGLISVSQYDLDIVLSPRLETPKSNTAFYYLAEMFAGVIQKQLAIA